MATIDPLISCLNRRSCFERLDVAWRAAERDGCPPERLQRLLAGGADKRAVMELAGPLIDICRATQRSYLGTFDALVVPDSAVAAG